MCVFTQLFKTLLGLSLIGGGGGGGRSDHLKTEIIRNQALSDQINGGTRFVQEKVCCHGYMPKVTSSERSDRSQHSNSLALQPFGAQ